MPPPNPNAAPLSAPVAPPYIAPPTVLEYGLLAPSYAPRAPPAIPPYIAAGACLTMVPLTVGLANQALRLENGVFDSNGPLSVLLVVSLMALLDKYPLCPSVI